MVYSSCYLPIYFRHVRAIGQEMISRLYLLNDSESNIGFLLRSVSLFDLSLVTVLQESIPIYFPHRSTSSAAKIIPAVVNLKDRGLDFGFCAKPISKTMRSGP